MANNRFMESREFDLRMILSANIKKFRARREWSQVALAEKLKISPNFLADIETGKSWISSTTLLKLSQVFDIDAYELFIPQKTAPRFSAQNEAESSVLIDRFAKDMAIALKQSVNKALDSSLENVRARYFGKKQA